MEVTMVSAVKDYFRRYATFSGRSSCAQFWWVVLAQLILGVIMTIPAVFISIAGATVPFVGMGLMMVLNIVNAVIFLGLLVPNIALLVRRLHDTGRGGGIREPITTVAMKAATLFPYATTSIHGVK